MVFHGFFDAARQPKAADAASVKNKDVTKKDRTQAFKNNKDEAVPDSVSKKKGGAVGNNKAAGAAGGRSSSSSSSSSSHVKNAKNEKKKNSRKRPAIASSNGAHGQQQQLSPQQPPPPHKKQRHATTTNHRTRTTTTTRRPPSAEALDLSRRLKECSQLKQLDRALELYESNQSIVDEHHACILIDCCARCGRVETAVAIAQPFMDQADNDNDNDKDNDKDKARSGPPNVETMTALMKAYAHGGYMKDCMRLFERTIDQANVRTLNTILRGCLWTAVDAQGFGGVETSEAAWRLYFSKHAMNHVSVGTSAFEYAFILLCQALRVGEAKDRVQRFLDLYKVEYKGAAGFHFREKCPEEEQSVLETMAVAHAALARAYAMLALPDELWTAAQRALCAIRLSRQRLQEQQNSSGNDYHPQQQQQHQPSGKIKRTRYIMSGGKQGWKGLDRTPEADAARATSNVRYRMHRLDELEREVKDIINVRSNLPTTSQTGKLLRERLWYQSGGGSTCNPIPVDPIDNNGDDDDDDDDDDDVSSSGRSDLATNSDVAAWKSFGLSQLEQQQQQQQQQGRAGKQNKKKRKKKKKSKRLATHATFLDQDGRLDCAKLFGNENAVELEIGAGFGSWIVHQAKQTKDRNYLAIEMKADRVAQIVSRCALERLSNLSIVGADCLSFLRHSMAPNSLANAYANHPEPPTQTFGLYDRDRLDRIAKGDVTSEPAHMLTSGAMMQIATCLATPSSKSGRGAGAGNGGGRFTIVTDNRNFVRLLTATVACAIIRATTPMIQQQKQQHHEGASLPVWPKLASVGPDRIRRDGSSLTLVESPTFSNGKVTVHVYEGKSGPGNNSQSNSSSNSNKNGRSYFDQLWTTGAGSHAERTTRFFIILERMR